MQDESEDIKEEEEEDLSVEQDQKEKIPEEWSPTCQDDGCDFGEGSTKNNFVKNIISHFFLTTKQRRSGSVSSREINELQLDTNRQPEANSLIVPRLSSPKRKNLNPRKQSTFCRSNRSESPSKAEEGKSNSNAAYKRAQKMKKDFRMSQKQLFKNKMEDTKINKQDNEDFTKVTRKKSESSVRRQSLKKETRFCKNYAKSPEEGTLSIDVSDTGCGISEADKEQLFKPFSQANKTVHSKFGGTGLGLWLSHKLVMAMKGTITCNSTPGKGTTFTIKLPLKCKATSSNENINNAQQQQMFEGMIVLSLVKGTNEFEFKLKKLGCKVVICRKVEDMLNCLRVILGLTLLGKQKTQNKKASRICWL